MVQQIMDKWNIVISNQERIIELQERSLFTLQAILLAVQPKKIINTEWSTQSDKIVPHPKLSHISCNCEECNGG